MHPDWTAARIANFALTHIATPWYRAIIECIIRYGLDAAVNDTKKEEQA